MTVVDTLLAPGSISSGILTRERLFDHFDRLFPGNSIWVNAPAGSGKTTLVSAYLTQRRVKSVRYLVDQCDHDPASFCFHFGEAASLQFNNKHKKLLHLTPEYLFALPQFTRRYVRQLYESLPEGSGIMIDNFQNIPSGSPVIVLVGEMIAALPDSMGLFLVSREEPPSRYVPYRIDDRLSVVGWRQLQLTDAELTTYLQGRIGSEPTAAVVHRLLQKTDGWFAGIVLMVEHLRLNGTTAPDEFATTPQEIFDFFTEQILEAGDSNVDYILMATSLLSRLTSDMAAELTGDRNAGSCLEALAQRNFFTFRESGKEIRYHYHQLFREFLLCRASGKLVPETLAALKERAAGIAMRAGEYEDAARLYVELEQWPALSNILAAVGPALLAQGRRETISAWIERVPLPERRKSGCLSYWEACSMTAAGPLSAREIFLAAAELYCAEGNLAGRLESLACAGDMSLQALEFAPLDDLLDGMAQLLRQPSRYPGAGVGYHVTMSMFHALSVRKPDHPDMKIWRSNALELLETSTGIDVNMLSRAMINIATDRVWHGDFVLADLLMRRLQRLKDSPQLTELHRTMIINMMAIHAMFADIDLIPGIVTRGLAVAEETGIGFWNVHLLSTGAVAALSSSDLDGAAAIMQQMAGCLNEGVRFDTAIYHLITAWKLLLEGRPALAARHQEEAVRLVRAIGWTLIEPVFLLGLAIAENLSANPEKATSLLDEARTLTDRIGSRLDKLMCLLVEAELQFGAERHDEGRTALGEALAIWREMGVTNIIWWRQPVMAELLMRALDAGLEREFVRGLIRKRRIIPEQPPLLIEGWPWPIRIYTLGSFRIELDEKPLEFKGKVQKKPLELLKALIARGGTNVSIRELCDALWPSAEGDAAAASFAITLFRLRQLLGADEAVQATDGVVTLNPHLVWVDFRAFESLAAAARADWEGGSEQRAADLTGRALALYRGDFLTAERDVPWTYAMRERLRSRFTRKIGRLCSHWEQNGQLHRSIGCFLDAIEVNPLVEEFYHNLMLCQLRAGQRTEALQTYERCRKTLAIELCISTSPGIEELYRSIIGSP